MLQVTASDAFGHEATALAADVTGPAFGDNRSSALLPGPGPGSRHQV